MCLKLHSKLQSFNLGVTVKHLCSVQTVLLLKIIMKGYLNLFYRAPLGITFYMRDMMNVVYLHQSMLYKVQNSTSACGPHNRIETKQRRM